MRPEIIVFVICLSLMAVAVVFCYICLVVASDADRREEEQIKKKLCVKEAVLPDSNGGWEKVTPISPEILDSQNVATKSDISSESVRKMLEKKAEGKHGDQD